jgi:hypothetical protein
MLVCWYCYDFIELILALIFIVKDGTAAGLRLE